MQFEYNIDKIRMVLQNFSILTGFKTTFFDTSFRCIVTCHGTRTSLCEAFANISKDLILCSKCDMTGLRKANDLRKVYRYRCHAGLYEIYFPILEYDKVCGYVSFGQFLIKEDKYMNMDIIHMLCSQYFSDDFINTAVSDLKSFSESYINAASDMMKHCIDSMLYQKLIYMSSKTTWNKIYEYVQDNISNKMNLRIASDDLFFSRSTIAHITKESTGISFCSYVTQQKLVGAANLISSTNMSIKRVASLYGFDDSNAFSTLFSKHIGYSPSEYRRKTAAKNTKNLLMLTSKSDSTAFVTNLLSITDETAVYPIYQHTYLPSLRKWYGFPCIGSWIGPEESSNRETYLKDGVVAFDIKNTLFGNQSIRIDMNKTTVTQVTVPFFEYASKFKPNVKYTFQAWVKTENIVAEPGRGASLSIYARNSLTQEEVQNQTFFSKFLSGTNNWQLISITFTLAEGMDNDDVLLFAVNSTHNYSGISWFDCIAVIQSDEPVEDFSLILPSKEPPLPPSGYIDHVPFIKPEIYITTEAHNKFRSKKVPDRN